MASQIVMQIKMHRAYMWHVLAIRDLLVLKLSLVCCEFIPFLSYGAPLFKVVDEELRWEQIYLLWFDGLSHQPNILKLWQSHNWLATTCHMCMRHIFIGLTVWLDMLMLCHLVCGIPYQLLYLTWHTKSFDIWHMFGPLG